MIRFDDISREERYFSATILPYLFAYANFTGLRSFENRLLEEKIIQPPSLDYKNVQLLSEVSLERDLPFAKIAIPSSAFDRKLKRQTKPDLMIITNETLYLMECKVFMKESEFKLHRQILEQKYILDIVEQVTKYPFENVLHVLILPYEYDVPDCTVFTWEKMYELFKRVVPEDNYFMLRMKRAILRIK